MQYLKKGNDEKADETAASRRAQGELSDEKKVKPQWIMKKIIPAMKRIRTMIEDDIAKDEIGDRKGLTHRRITSVMTDAGAEFQLTFKEWLAQEGISSITCEAETHEEMSRLNIFSSIATSNNAIRLNGENITKIPESRAA